MFGYLDQIPTFVVKLIFIHQILSIVEYESNSGRFESVYSNKVRAGRRRTYFFDVRRTKGEDYYLTMTESTKRFNGEGYERHKIFLYKEDFHRFRDALNETIEFVKTELLPDYDYDEFTRRHEEWEAQRAEEAANGGATPKTETKEEAPASIETEDDMAW